MQPRQSALVASMCLISALGPLLAFIVFSRWDPLTVLQGHSFEALIALALVPLGAVGGVLLAIPGFVVWILIVRRLVPHREIRASLLSETDGDSIGNRLLDRFLDDRTR